MYLGLTPWDNVLGQRLRTVSWGEILGGSTPGARITGRLLRIAMHRASRAPHY